MERKPIGTNTWNSKTGSRTRNNNAAVFSSALQDHLLKKLNYKIDDGIIKRNPIKTTLPVIQKRTSSRRQTEIENLAKKQKQSILPYESESLKRLKEMKSDEEKMAKYNKKLTWAQKLGIVEKPPLPMTAADWAIVEEKSKKRNDSESICSICLEDFKIQPQTILSCSHVFHQKCLTSFEQHNKVRCCPICRKKDYEKKMIDEAIRIFTMKSIIRIQRVFRGSRTRIMLYKKLVEQGYICKSKLFNRRLIGYKMWRLSNKIADKMKKDQKHFDQLLGQLQARHKKETDDILSQMVEVQRQRVINEGAIEQYLERFGIRASVREHAAQMKVQPNWSEAIKKGMEREEDECSICLGKLWVKPVYLLSCSHTFHVNCIESFERYGLPGSQKKCPCCRSEYEKKVVEKKR